MAHIQASKPLLEHLNATEIELNDIAYGASQALEEALPKFREQLSEARTEDNALYCSGLEEFHQSVEALSRFQILSRHLESPTANYYMLASALMDIAELDSAKFKNIRKSGISIDDSTDVSIAHLMEQHGEELQQVIRKCIEQSSMTGQSDLRDRFNTLFKGTGPRPGGP